MTREEIVKTIVDAGARKTFDNRGVQEYSFRPKPERGEVMYCDIYVGTHNIADNTRKDEWGDWGVDTLFDDVEEEYLDKLIRRCKTRAKRPLREHEIKEVKP